MSDIHRTFAGSIPAYYDRYLVPLLFEPYAHDLVRRLRVSQNASVLELACGTGVVTERLAAALGSDATVTATDLNQGMIDVAQAKLGGDQRIIWRQADATDLPFEDGVFDAAVCQFGWMFFPDRARAMREARRVLRAGGQLSFNTWDRLSKNPVLAEVDTAIRACFPGNPPTFYDVPFGMFDTAEHEQLASETGFGKVKLEHVQLQGAPMLALEIATGLIRGGPFITEIEERGGNADVVIADAARRLTSRFGSGPITSRLSAFVCSAFAL